MNDVIELVRNKPMFSEKGNLEELLVIDKFPVFIGTTKDQLNNDIFTELAFDIDQSNGIIQLSRPLKHSIVYSYYHSEALGTTWDEHREMFSEFINNDYKNILDIGGSSGSLAKQHISKYDSYWTIIDPNILKAKGQNNRIEYIEGLIEEKPEKLKYKDAIVHSHTLEHIYDPIKFLYTLTKNLKIGTTQIFSIPNFQAYLENNQSNVLNFEHTYLLTENLTDVLLNVFGFEISKKYYFKNHSIFYKSVLNKPNLENINKKIEEKISNDYLKNKKNFIQSFNKIENLIRDFHKLQKENKESQCFIFGAHIFSQIFYFKGINFNLIKNVLDNSELKENTRLYGTNWFVKKPEVLSSFKNPILILNVGQYQDEVKSQILKINPTTLIVE